MIPTSHYIYILAGPLVAIICVMLVVSWRRDLERTLPVIGLAGAALSLTVLWQFWIKGFHSAPLPLGFTTLVLNVFALVATLYFLILCLDEVKPHKGEKTAYVSMSLIAVTVITLATDIICLLGGIALLITSIMMVTKRRASNVLALTYIIAVAGTLCIYLASGQLTLETVPHSPAHNTPQWGLGTAMLLTTLGCLLSLPPFFFAITDTKNDRFQWWYTTTLLWTTAIIILTKLLHIMPARGTQLGCIIAIAAIAWLFWGSLGAVASKTISGWAKNISTALIAAGFVPLALYPYRLLDSAIPLFFGYIATILCLSILAVISSLPRLKIPSSSFLSDIVLATSLISLAGLPPTLHFISRYYTTAVLLKNGFIYLAISFVCGTATLALACIKPVTQALQTKPSEDTPLHLSTIDFAVLFCASMIFIYLTVFPDTIAGLAKLSIIAGTAP